jgi:predicted transcriptional regulator
MIINKPIGFGRPPPGTRDIMSNDLKSLTVEIVSAHICHNVVAPDDMPGLISSVYRALDMSSAPAEPDQPRRAPAVPVRASVKPGYLISLESGRKMKMLKRYLRTNYDMSPADYRAKWGLPADYPMVAPDYAQRRSEIAKSFGLGHGGRMHPRP